MAYRIVRHERDEPAELEPGVDPKIATELHGIMWDTVRDKQYRHPGSAAKRAAELGALDPTREYTYREVSD